MQNFYHNFYLGKYALAKNLEGTVLHTLISPRLFPFFLRLPSRFSSNIICILFGNDEGIHQLDFSDPVLDLAPACNLDNERDVGTIKYKLRSLEQSS